MIDSARLPAMAAALVERLQLLSEILGAALQRGRHESALRANVAVIERLNARLEADNVYLKEEIKSYHDFDDIVGESAALGLALAAAVAGRADELERAAARADRHRQGAVRAGAARAQPPRTRGRWSRVNCAALPPTLVESELFGHEKGAFTGAVAMRQGRFELADGGTIFLDEIGDLAPDDPGEVPARAAGRRIRARRIVAHARRVDVRVIAATHRDLEAAVAAGHASGPTSTTA